MSSTISSPPSYSCGLGEKQRGRQIGANAQRRAGDLPDRVVDVIAEGLSASIQVEQRRKDPERQRRGREQRAVLQRGENQVAQLAPDGMILGQLQVVLDLRRLAARGHPAIHPVGGIEQAARMRHLLGAENVRNLQKHCVTGLPGDDRAEQHLPRRARQEVAIVGAIRVLSFPRFVAFTCSWMCLFSGYIATALNIQYFVSA